MYAVLNRSRSLAIAAVVTIALLPASGSASAGTNAQARARVLAELSGIPQAGNVLGNPAAPVTVRWFGDLECPICREFALGALPSIIHRFVRSGKVKIEYRSFETATREPPVFHEQQAAALAAGRQDLAWYYLELFYREQREPDSGYVTPRFLRGIAEQVPGLDVARWESQRTDPSFLQELERDEAKANHEGFFGTPAFIFSRRGGTTIKRDDFTTTQLNEAPALFEPLIERLLKRSHGRGRR